MIYLIDGRNIDQYSGYLKDWLKQRYDHFVKHRGWADLESYFGLEVDQYDLTDHAQYLLCIDQGLVIGGIRVLSTDYGSLVGDHFRQYLFDQNYPFSVKVAEMCRLYVNDTAWRSSSGHAALTLIWANMIRHLLNCNVKKLIAAGDAILVKRLLPPPHWQWREIGERSWFPQRGHPDGEAAIVEIDIDQSMHQAFCKFKAYDGGDLMRAEEALKSRPSVVLPERLYQLNTWLKDNSSSVKSLQRIVQNADNDEESRTAFIDAVKRCNL